MLVLGTDHICVPLEKLMSIYVPDIDHGKILTKKFNVWSVRQLF